MMEYNAKGMKRYLLIASSILLLVSALGAYTVFRLPTELKVRTPLVNYEHSGKFDYLVYLKPSYLFGPEPQEPPPPPLPPPPPPPLSNLKYPSEIIDRFNFTFAYHFTPEQPVKKVTSKVVVTATMKDAEGKPVETILVPESSAGGEFTIEFGLPITKDILDGKLTDIAVNVYVYPTIEIEKTVIFESFTQKLPIRRQGPIFEVDRASLGHSEPGYLGEIAYRQEGKLDCSVLLKSNSPFGEVALRPPSPTPPPPPPLPSPPPPPPPKTIGPGEVIFAKLVDRIDATFEYKFKSSKPVKELNEEITITAVIENPKVWSKSIVLVPPTKKKGNFSVSFPIDINELSKTLETIRSETGVSAESYKFTIQADVHVVCQTDFGPIDEVFSQTLSSPLGKGTVEWEEKLAQSKASALEKDTVIPNSKKYMGLSIAQARNFSILLASIVCLFFLFSVVLYARLKPVELSWIEKEALQVKKKYGERVAEAMGGTPMEGEKIISLGSLEDLVKVADELSKPIIHQSPNAAEERHIYYISDGAIRYQYVLATKGSR